MKLSFPAFFYFEIGGLARRDSLLELAGNNPHYARLLKPVLFPGAGNIGVDMSLQWIAIIVGTLATAGGVVGIVRPELIKRFAEVFPRGVAPAWIFTALCCALGAREAHLMNMGAVDVVKPYIPFIAVAVFVASVVYMKELLAPRALGGFLCLIAVPITKTAALSGAPFFQVLVAVVYLGVIYGIILLMSPWYFRKFYKPFMENAALFKAAAFAKTMVGALLLLLGVFVY